MIYKQDDDISMDVSVMRLFEMCNETWARRGMPARLRTYKACRLSAGPERLVCDTAVYFPENGGGYETSQRQSVPQLQHLLSGWEQMRQSLHCGSAAASHNRRHVSFFTIELQLHALGRLGYACHGITSYSKQ
jgi:hypothetical protein